MLQSKDETIHDLEEQVLVVFIIVLVKLTLESLIVQGPSINTPSINFVQIKDFKFSIKVQKSIEKNGGGIKGGTLVPLPMVSDSGGKGKRSSKTNKRKN